MKVVWVNEAFGIMEAMATNVRGAPNVLNVFCSYTNKGQFPLDQVVTAINMLNWDEEFGKPASIYRELEIVENGVQFRFFIRRCDLGGLTASVVRLCSEIQKEHTKLFGQNEDAPLCPICGNALP